MFFAKERNQNKLFEYSPYTIELFNMTKTVKIPFYEINIFRQQENEKGISRSML